MPIYEYRCSECSFQDEFLQKLSDPLMTVCPSCGKESLKKMLSAAGSSPVTLELVRARGLRAADLRRADDI